MGIVQGIKMAVQPLKFLTFLLLCCFTTFATGQTIDLDPPEITHTVQSSVKPGKDVQVTATITDKSGIEQATVFYRDQQIGPYQSVDMNNATGNEYTATLATVKGQDILQYYIEVVDTGGNRVLEGSPSSPLVVKVASKSSLLYIVAGALAIGLIAGASGSGDSDGPIPPGSRELTIGVGVPSQ